MKVLLAVFVLLGEGCSSVDDAKSLPPLIPLRVGAEWTYSIADSGWLPTLKDSVATVHVTAAAGVWFGVDDSNALGTSGGFIWFTNGGDGVYETNHLPGLAYRAWPYPVQSGDTVLAQFGGPMYVASIDTVVVAPAGTFHCILYEWLGGANHASVNQWTWFAPGVGLVKDARVTASDGKGNLRMRVRILTGRVE